VGPKVARISLTALMQSSEAEVAQGQEAQVVVAWMEGVLSLAVVRVVLALGQLVKQGMEGHGVAMPLAEERQG
jgi:hypothetical protein